MRKVDPLFICCADLHVQDNPPIARTGEPDWLASQDYMLKQIQDKAEELAVPVIYAGDVVDKPTKHSSALIQMLIKRIPSDSHIILGNHDIINHSLDSFPETTMGLLDCVFSINKCAHILAASGKTVFDDAHITFFPFGTKYTKPKHKGTNIAIIHEFIWETPPFPGAPEHGNIKELTKALKGYDLIIAGDNHSGFITECNGIKILNCGCTMRRTILHEDYKPAFYVVNDDLSVETIYFDISKDVFSKEHKIAEMETETLINDFIDVLGEMKTVTSDFEENMKRALMPATEDVKACVYRAMEESNDV